MKVKSESEVAQLCLTLSDPVDCSLPGSSVHGIFQARVLEWVTIAFSKMQSKDYLSKSQIIFRFYLGQVMLEWMSADGDAGTESNDWCYFSDPWLWVNKLGDATRTFPKSKTWKLFFLVVFQVTSWKYFPLIIFCVLVSRSVFLGWVLAGKVGWEGRASELRGQVYLGLESGWNLYIQWWILLRWLNGGTP